MSPSDFEGLSFFLGPALSAWPLVCLTALVSPKNQQKKPYYVKIQSESQNIEALKYFSEKEVLNVDRFIGTSIGFTLLLDLSINFPVTAVETEEDYPFVTDSFTAEMGRPFLFFCQCSKSRS